MNRAAVSFNPARMPFLRYSLLLIGCLSGPLLAQGQTARHWDGPTDRFGQLGDRGHVETGPSGNPGIAAKASTEPGHVRPAAYQGIPREDQPSAGNGEAGNSPEAHRERSHREVGPREPHQPGIRPLSTADAAAPRSTGPMITTLGSLALVVGAFLLVMWFVRRHLPRGTGPLPSDVLEVLGRSTIGPKQPVSLLRLGDRLLLVALHAGSAETLAEITDPDEVTRLVGICQQARPNSATGAFRQVLNQVSGPPRAGKAEDRHA